MIVRLEGHGDPSDLRMSDPFSEPQGQVVERELFPGNGEDHVLQ